METKSRYEVISDLEQKKRSLINEKNELDFEVTSKKRRVVEFERDKENLKTQEQDFLFKQEKQKQALENEKKDFDFRMNNTQLDCDRRIADAKEDIINFESTLKQRKEAIDEQIKSINESLERFSALQKK